jgi:LmbE family N-acetylglucosaminyl deacetylase
MQSLFHPGHVLVISPHLDDAVLGCAMLLSASEQASVLTVFAAEPPEGQALSAWDRGCGYASGVAAMRARRLEDESAMAVLGAAPHYLDFLDSQYGRLPGKERLAEALVQAIDGIAPDVVCLPLGLHHCDHERVHDAGLLAWRRRPGMLWLAYEDVLYRARAGVLQQRLARLLRQGATASPIASAQAGNAPAKRRALKAYRSQLRALGLRQGGGDPAAPERYWLLQAR